MERPMKLKVLLSVGLILCSSPALHAAEPPDVSTATTKPFYDPYSAPPLPAGDPMEWKESATLPALRERLTGDIYRERYTAALAKAPALTPQQAESLPVFGLRITKVFPGSQATRLGIKRGDLLLKLEGKPLMRFAQILAPRQSDQALTFQPTGGEIKQVTVTPAKIGITMEPYWNAYISYLLSKGKMATYDDDLRVAAANFLDDQPLAETALWHAWQHGYRDYPLLGMMAFINSRECHFEDGLAFAMHSLKETPPLEREEFAGLAYDAAVATFKLELARDLLRQYPTAGKSDDAAELLHTAIAAYHAFPQELLPNPIEQLRMNPYPDATAKIIALPTDEWKDGDEFKKWGTFAANEFALRHRLKVESPTAQYLSLMLGPPVANLDLSLRFNVTPSDGKTDSDFAKSFWIVVLDRSREPVTLVAAIAFLDSGAIQVTCTGGPNFTHEFKPAIGIRRFGRVHIAVVGHRIEVVADGRRLLYGPVMADSAVRKIAVAFRVVGLKGDVDELTWRVP